MAELATATSTQAPRKRWSAAMIAPLATFVAIAVFFGIGLTRDPREIPSPLIGKPIPDFSLSPVQGRTLGLASANLRGGVSLVNVFASWCVACREEHPT